MSTLVSREQSSHWYLSDGTPFHSVPCKSRPGEMRSATIADARSAGAVPSVTNILSVIAKPALTAWLQEQAIMAALTLPRSPDEPLDAFAKRVVKDMDAQSDKARELGSQVHEACAEFMRRWRDTPQPGQGEMELSTDLALPFCKWGSAHVTKVHAVEEVFVGDGYAGRCDLIADVDSQTSIIDLKTQAVKNGKPSFWNDWVIQLAAYRSAALDKLWVKSPVQLISIVIDVNPDSPIPGAVHPHVWPEGTFDDDVYYETFMAAFKVWKHSRGWNL